MKKYVLILMAVFTMSMAFAQAPQGGFKPQLSNKSKTEMAQKRTDKMVKKYGLNAKQAKDLQMLNTEYQGEIGMPGGKRKNKRMHTCDCPCCKMMMAMMQQCMMQHRKGHHHEMNDSMHQNDSIENLVKKLPGAEISDDGMIKVNGKKIDKILVNGKPMMQMSGEKKLDRAKMEEMMEERKIAREEYDAKLAKIMNKKQFAEYKSNSEKKQKRFNPDNK
jgi:hypothetical protein